MRKLAQLIFSSFLISSLLFTSFPLTNAAAQSAGCVEGKQISGARYRICLPEGDWNGDLVLYAHGYVPAGSPLALPGEASALSSHVRGLGYAFATTSYRVNGLAVLPAVDDLLELVQIFTTTHAAPRRVFLVGASEGGLVTTLSVERHSDVYAGGLALCGPIGDFRDQIAYFGDFRVVFDAYFPGLIPGDSLEIPDTLASSWPAAYQNTILPVLMDATNRQKLLDLFAVTGAPYDPAHLATLESTVRGALGYNIYATNDAREKLAGQPYGNTTARYAGSSDDAWINQAVRRVTADPTAQSALDEYATTGRLQVPLVAMHTTGDEIVPFRHLDRYQARVTAAGADPLFVAIPVERYGHCNFHDDEILAAFTRLVALADTPPILAPSHTPTLPTLAAIPTPAPSSTVGDNSVENGAPAPRARESLLQRFIHWLNGFFKGSL